MSFEAHPNYKKFHGLSLLGVDYGLKVTGLASFCPGRDPFPMPYGRLLYVSDQKLVSDIANLIREEVFEAVVLGIPYLTDGQSTDQTKRVENFAKSLQHKIDVELYLQDETLSTKEAEERMMNSPRYNFRIEPKQIDALCAAIILEDFISSRESKAPYQA